MPLTRYLASLPEIRKLHPFERALLQLTVGEANYQAIRTKVRLPFLPGMVWWNCGSLHFVLGPSFRQMGCARACSKSHSYAQVLAPQHMPPPLVRALKTCSYSASLLRWKGCAFCINVYGARDPPWSLF